MWGHELTYKFVPEENRSNILAPFQTKEAENEAEPGRLPGGGGEGLSKDARERGAARVSCPGKHTGDLNVGCWVESVGQVGGGGFANYIVIRQWVFEYNES